MAMERPTRERATLQAVAERAGVSPSTVSLVLSGKADQRRIPQSTREKVWSAAEELNYAPNLLVRSLRRGRTHVISFYSTFRNRRRGDLYMDRLASAVETAGGELGYDVLVHCNFRRTPRETYQFLNGGFADGLLLFAPTPKDPLLAMLRRSSLPVVILNGLDERGQYSSASDDVEQGMRLVVEELLSRGHRSIAALGSVGDDVRDSVPRIELLRSELARRGIPLEEDRVEWISFDPAEAMERLLALPDRPTALFCWHDALAYRVLEWCEARGVAVPEELSVVGYDGVHWPSTSRHICASVEVDLEGIALTAVHLLDRSINLPGSDARHVSVPIRFNPGTTLSTISSLQRSKS
jgi:DNA-binding LacI/PurR family transcriptional regulator